MPTESRVQRWRTNKRQQGLKHVSVWLTDEEELHLKDLAILWHCSPSQVVQRALARMSTSAPEHSSPTDTSQIRRLILAELAALGIAMPAATGRDTVGDTVGPSETVPQHTPAATASTHAHASEPGHSIVTEPTPQRKRGRQRSAIGHQILALLADHPEGLSAEQMRGYLTPGKRIGDTLAGMKRLGTVRTQGQGRTTRYFARV